MAAVLRVVGCGLIGAAAFAGTIYYFAWAVSIGSPVDWPQVTSAAAFAAPLGLVVGLLIGWEVESR